MNGSLNRQYRILLYFLKGLWSISGYLSSTIDHSVKWCRKGWSTIWKVFEYTETKTFENKYWTGKKRGKKKSISAYGTQRKSDFGQT